MTESLLPRVIVAHPGLQHSERVAIALARSGMLSGYWTGAMRAGNSPTSPEQVELLSMTSRWPVAPILRRLMRLAAGRNGEQAGDYLGNRLFDRLAARRVTRCNANLVIGYEVGCARLFAAARRTDIRTILDAASIHHRSQDAWRSTAEPPALHRRLISTKEREIALADHVVVASELAAETYREAGIAREKLSVVPLGVDLQRFFPVSSPDGRVLRILFVGKMTETKGFDVLLRALAAMAGSRAEIALRVAGQGRWTEPLSPGFEVGEVAHADLPLVYTKSDLLVLPSRFDGFGLVVVEALACGTPVIVSDRVGAGDVVQEGVNGWIVPAGSEAKLAARLTWCADHLPDLRSMRPSCRRSVESYGWEAFERRLVGVVNSVFTRPRQ